MKGVEANLLDRWIEGWVRCLQKAPPYNFPDDDLSDIACITLKDHGEFIQSAAFKCRDSKYLHLGLIPQPYMGDLKTARLVMLSLNPGLSYGEYVYDRDERFRRVLIANIKQELGSHEFPFIFLNPEFAWHSGFSYWTKHLRGLIEAVLEAGWADTFNDALRFVAQRIACVELVPYHSKKASSLKTLKLESTKHALKYVDLILASKVSNQQCLLLALRKASLWQELCSSAKIHVVNSPQSGSVSRANCKSWKQILDILRPKRM